jgi:hypothetical protein
MLNNHEIPTCVMHICHCPLSAFFEFEVGEVRMITVAPSIQAQRGDCILMVADRSPEDHDPEPAFVLCVLENDFQPELISHEWRQPVKVSVEAQIYVR